MIRDWSLPELAAQLRLQEERLKTKIEIGLTTDLVSKWEKGRTHPSRFYLARLCLLYQVSPAEIGFATSALLEAEIGKLGGVRKTNDQASILPTNSPAVALPRYWNVPHHRNPFFSGRDEILSQLHQLFHADQNVIAVTQQAICGLGGIGKTQVSLEYAYRFSSKYDAVLWVTADNDETIRADLISIADMLFSPGRKFSNERETITAVREWLRENNRWLLILDNADDPQLVEELASLAQNGHVLLTTRAQAVGAFAYRVELHELSVSAGISLLLKRSGILPPLADLHEAMDEHLRFAGIIVQELGGFPLAIDQAAAYLEETLSSLEDFLILYQQKRQTLLNRRGGLHPHHPASVVTTFSLSFQVVERKDKVAADLLRLCAFLDPDVIPEEILTKGISSTSIPFQDDARLHFDQALSHLLRFSLISRNPDTKMLTVHRLVQACLEDHMDEASKRHWRSEACRAVETAFPQESTAYSSSGQPHHAVQVLRASLHLKNLPSLMSRLAVQQQVLGRLKESEQTLQDCLQLCLNGRWHYDLIKAHQYMALLRSYQGLHEQAKSHLDFAETTSTKSDLELVGSALHAYRALDALLANDPLSAQAHVKKALSFASQSKVLRDIVRANWLQGKTLIELSHRQTEPNLLSTAEKSLQAAFEKCRQHKIVDYEADLLLAFGHLHLRKKELKKSRTFAFQALTIARQSGFQLLQADIHNFLAELSFTEKKFTEASDHARSASKNAYCDGSPYSYRPALNKAQRYLNSAEVEYEGEAS